MDSGGLDDTPELATDAAWRKAARAAREAKGWTQKQLAEKVGASQNIISLLENGEIASSKAVLPISRLLGVAAPVFARDDLERRWIDAGRVLRARNPRLFRRHLQLAEAYGQEEDGDDDGTETDR